jgi:hypothetical protein
MFAARFNIGRTMLARTKTPKLTLNNAGALLHGRQQQLHRSLPCQSCYTTFVPVPVQPELSLLSTLRNWFSDALWQMSSTVKKRRSKMNKCVMQRIRSCCLTMEGYDNNKAAHITINRSIHNPDDSIYCSRCIFFYDKTRRHKLKKRRKLERRSTKN